MSDATADAIADLDPEDVDPERVPMEALETALTAEEASTRIDAARLAASVAKAEPTAIEPVVPSLADGLEDDTSIVAFQSLKALMALSRASPAELEPAVPGMVGLLKHDLPLVQSVAARTLGHLSGDHPEFFVDHVPALLAATDQPDATVLEPDEVDAEMIRLERTQHRQANNEATTQREIARETAPNLLVEVATHDPSALAPHADAVVELLEDRNAGVVAAAADVVATLAADSPDEDVAEALEAAVDPLVDQFDHFDDGVVANAIAALGYLEAEETSDDIATVADDEERPAELRELAADTAAYLEDDD